MSGGEAICIHPHKTRVSCALATLSITFRAWLHQCSSSKIPGLGISLTVSHPRYPTGFITSPHMASQPGLPIGRVLGPAHRNPLIISGHFYLLVPSGSLTLNPHLPWFHHEGLSVPLQCLHASLSPPWVGLSYCFISHQESLYLSAFSHNHPSTTSGYCHPPSCGSQHAPGTHHLQ